MKKEDDLHALVRSMDSSERRHFTVFAGRHVIGEGNHYLALFQELAGQAEYDDDSLKALLLRLGAKTPLPAAKHQLKLLVLRALRSYRSDSDAHTRMLEGLGNLAILHEKRQYGLMRKEISRLKHLAEAHGEHHIAFKVADYARRLHKETARKQVLEGMEDILSDVRKQAQAFENQMEMTHLLDRTFLLAKLSRSEALEGLEQMLKHPLLSDENHARTLHARIYFHQVHAIASQVRGTNSLAMEHYRKVVALWESAPQLIEDAPGTYRRILSNYLGICHLLDRYEDYEGLLTKIRGSKVRSEGDRAEVFNIGHYYALLWRMGRHEWAGVRQLLQEIKSGLAEYGAFLDVGRVLAFRYNGAVFHFLAEDYTNCRKWLVDILHMPRSEQRTDIQQLAPLLGAFCSHALGDLDLMENQLRAAQRLAESASTSAVARAALHLARGLLQAPPGAAQQAVLQAFLSETEGLALMLGQQELRAWAIGRWRGISPLEVVAGRLA